MSRSAVIAIFGAFALFMIDGAAIVPLFDQIERRLARLGQDEAAPAAPAASGFRRAWTQPDAHGGLLVRSVAPAGTECPAANAGGDPLELEERRPISRAQFDVVLCELTLEPDAAARLQGVAWEGTPVASITLKPLKKAPRSVVILGDTGCRMTYFRQQDCRYEWPFGAIARKAAGKSPDLVIHVGDYHYRERPCPDGVDKCAGSTWGDNWAAWRQDFFEPARPLLEAAPWVAVRGNHEDCERAGDGWMHFLNLPEAGGGTGPCQAVTAAYDLDFDALSLLVLDTASLTKELHPVDRLDDDDPRRFRAMCERLGAFRQGVLDGGSKAGLHLVLFHQPIESYLDNRTTSWGYSAAAEAAGGKVHDPVIEDSRALCTALMLGEEKDAPKPKVKVKMMPDRAILKTLEDLAAGGVLAAAVSGDAHDFESVSREIEGGRLVHQVVVGNGGTERDTTGLRIAAAGAGNLSAVPPEDCLRISAKKDADGQFCDRANFSTGGKERSVAHAFGYMHLRLVEGAGWQAALHDRDDRIFAVCGFPFDPVAGNRESIVAGLVSSGVSPRALERDGFTGEGCKVLGG